MPAKSLSKRIFHDPRMLVEHVMARAFRKTGVKNRTGPGRGLLPYSWLGCRFFNHHGQLQPAFLSRILFGTQAFGFGCEFGKAGWLLHV